MNNNRKEKRYRINQLLDNKNRKKYYFDIIINEFPIKARMADISFAGIGYEIESQVFTKFDEHEKESIELKIYYPENNINIWAKKIWSIIFEDDGREFLKGGMMFTSLSSDQRQKLTDLFDSFNRKSSYSES